MSKLTRKPFKTNESSMKIFFPSFKPVILFSILLLVFQTIEAQDIVVPDANKSKASPIVFNPSTSKEGQSIYEKNCLSCHGNPGKGNYLKALTPPPADLATEKLQNQTDGEIFYKISEGNPIMPKFKTTLTEEERWKLVSYIRSFHKKYVQLTPQKSAGILRKNVYINIHYDSIKRELFFLAKALVKRDTIPIKGTEVSLFVKRYFGRLPIGAPSKTNDKGIATFDFPRNLPGDKNGNIELLARMNDDVYGEIVKLFKLKIGIPIDKPSLTAKRAMWNVESKSPIWLLLTYFSIVTGVWLTIAYIIFNIYRIKKLSSRDKHKKTIS
jgi:hypothetical protein